ncbi:type II toxin-antitoxin system Phd/YefM family antitoxin [Pseudonocardia nigra]|uniref:type II toxin-antitoxin system Phd/YefM family antitoxin n=1 Tax=Pseudonocardia nigra TaxID=1921578 RepID=UPI001C5CE457|nr:type II toxin-antitoxin system Phd/YefM family antitoxin [Pseudonocardia nigra]
MAEQVNVYEAKTHLSRLLERVEAGEEIVIARNGRPVARLVPTQRQGSPRVPGAWKGKVWIADDFDETDEELIDLMYNGPIFPSEDDSL